MLPRRRWQKLLHSAELPNFGRNMPKEEEEASSEVLEGCNHFAAAKNIFFSTSWSTPTDGVTGSSGVWSSPAELNKSVGDVSKSLSLSRGKEGKFVSRQIWINSYSFLKQNVENRNGGFVYFRNSLCLYFVRCLFHGVFPRYVLNWGWRWILWLLVSQWVLLRRRS